MRWRLIRDPVGIADAPRKNGSKSLCIAPYGMGSPAFATQSLNSPPSVSAPTRTGVSFALCVRALPIKFDASCPIRVRSQLTGFVIPKAVSIRRWGDAVRNSSTTCSRTGSSGWLASRFNVMSPPTREIRDVVNQVGHTVDRRVDHVEDAELFLPLQGARPLQVSGSGANGRKRVVQVVTKDRDELLA